MQCELDAPGVNGTWIVMPLPANSHAIGYKWVYKVKLNSDIYSLFTKSTNNGGFTALIVYVDDIVIDSTSMQLRNERKCTLDILEEFGLLGAKPVSTPIDYKHKISKTEKKDHLLDSTVYRQLRGKLLYLTLTRPDISYVVHVLSQYMDKPSEANQKLGFRALKYLKGVPGQGILLSIESDLNLQAHNSNDWVGCLDTRRSVTSYGCCLVDHL
ncbi:Cysteine-rich RLK (RECEPTOR-like protein kinase) 8 [Theobroma cacao]|uniref:Cysteine-rich RLK (RECEPTOR-like protein kinase) 8 n=1 Tax=Theobroma cacao TaxID=3641 RepID=A0A061F8W2_THECC|nr:Cysteine-rich RLK (RECEPTOR-like protein kinase) 8 [Theobroma cacao]